jgi:ATP-dependent helicase/nuclease subunit B
MWARQKHWQKPKGYWQMTRNDVGSGRQPESSTPRLYTIPQTAAFLDSLARAILAGDLPEAGGEPPARDALPHYTILLPTRRAVRAMREAFLRVTGGDVVLLPRIRALGDADEDDVYFAPQSDLTGQSSLALELPQPIGSLERRLVMTQLVLAWSENVASASSAGSVSGDPEISAATPAQAASLADDLIRLQDTIENEQADLSKLQALVPERFANHWQLTVEFLKIVTEHWPRYLEERGLISPYQRRNALMAEEARLLAANPPTAPVIAAGSTGSIPVTAQLLRTIANLPLGAVVLPGLDLELDQESWEAIGADHPEHPQFGMKQLLERIGAVREKVGVVPGSGLDGADRARLKLISEVMRPAGTTERWPHGDDKAPPGDLVGSIQGISLVGAPTPEDEAEVIAIIMRETLETPEKSAALVTPDRTLARRVAARLEKWNIRVDDSAGSPVAKAPPGVFMDLAIDAMDSGFAALPLLALLKHPLARLGRSAAGIRGSARVLELAAFRQAIPATGLEGALTALRRARTRADGAAPSHANRQLLGKQDLEKAEQLVSDVSRAFAPLTELFGRKSKVTIAELATAHVAVDEALACDESGDFSVLWSGEAGEALALILGEIMSGSNVGPQLAPRHYAEIYRILVAGLMVRPLRPAHPRLHIWGPLEARLQQADMVVLGGLNEGAWPRTEEADAWLNRPMRKEIGLPAPERRIGLAAHDVAQLWGAEKVTITRAQRQEGVPTVPSRWLLRLEAVLAGAGISNGLRPPEPWLAWAQGRDVVHEVRPAARPAPKPPLNARPRRLSVTRIEDWIANPYAIFARDILGLMPVNPIGGEPDAALRGRLVHDVMQRFAERYPQELPQEIANELMRLADALFEDFGAHPSICAFWRPQLERFARWFAATEPNRRLRIAHSFSEVPGELELETAAGGFTLRARADRTDLAQGGALAIYDYKTGQPPPKSAVSDGRAPQLPLEAAIAMGGGFRGIESHDVQALRFIWASGGRVPGEERDVSDGEAGALAEQALAGLRALIEAFERLETPYEVLRRPGFEARYRYDDYAHLARVAEWSSTDAETD